MSKAQSGLKCNINMMNEFCTTAKLCGHLILFRIESTNKMDTSAKYYRRSKNGVHNLALSDFPKRSIPENDLHFKQLIPEQTYLCRFKFLLHVINNLQSKTESSTVLLKPFTRTSHTPLVLS